MKIKMTTRARHLAALQLAVALVALVAGLAAGCSSDEGATTTQAATTTAVVTTTTQPPTTTSATTTTEAPTTTTEAPPTTAAAKTPMATVDELVAAVYAAVNAEDSAALWALSTDDAFHPIYYVEGKTGTISDNIAPGYDLASGPMQGIEVLGVPLLSGDEDVVVVPVAYTFPEPIGVLTGFDVLVVRHVDGGLLVGGAATFYADDRPDLVADPAEAWALIEALGAAMNADDVEGALATMSGLAVFAEDMTDVETYIRGTSALREFLTASLTVTGEFTGEPVMSGRFVAVPTRLSTDSGFFSDGVFVYWISDGRIALQAYAQGF